MKKRRRKFQFKISQKLAIFCIGLCFAIISILTVQYYNYSRNMLERQTQLYISDMLRQTGNNLDMVMDSIEALIFDIQKEPEVQNYLTQIQGVSHDSYSGYIAAQDLRNVIYKYILYDDNIESVVIVSESGKAELISKTLKDYSLDNSVKNKIYDAGGSAVWLGVNPSERYISVAAQINSLKTMKTLGYLVVQISESKFSEVFQDLSFVKDGAIFIVNQDNMIVSANSRNLLSTKLDTVYSDVMNPKSRQKFEIISLDKKEKYVTYSTLSNGTWNLMAVIPVISYKGTILELKQYFAVIFIIAVIAAVIMGILYTTLFSKPIKKLLQAMQEFGNGDFDIICNVTSSDEIGLLSQSFNMMVYNINDLIDKVYAETMLKQEAELKSLRMQINPHFLYNTLDTINWLSREKGIPEVGKIAKSLGDMMYHTINGSDFTSIEDEVKNINNYLMIQRTRYGDRIQFEVMIDQSLYEYKIPKLILQPLIENAIVHGVENKEEGGQIVVQGEVKKQMLHLAVIDNGIGMSLEKIKELLSGDSEEPEETQESIGVRNVNQRLKLYYGEQRGLMIQSIIGAGTEVRLLIPVIPG